LLLLVLLFFGSCGVKKVSAVEKGGVSMLNYPYIEKFHEGLRLKAKGEFDQAITAFNYCLGVRQNDDAVYFALSELYKLKKDKQKAIECLQKASVIDPINFWYTQELTYAQYDHEQYEAAAKNFEKLIQKEPSNVDWLYGYAECLVMLGKHSEAIKAFEKMEEQIGMHPDLTLQKFNLYLRAKQHSKAVDEIEKGRKEFPNDASLIGTLVDYYFQTKQDAKAINMLEELTKADPMNGRAHLGLADIYRQQGKRKEFYKELQYGFVCPDVDIDTKMKILISIHEEGTKLSTEAFALVNVMVEQYPMDAKSHSIQGDYFLRMDSTQKALISYQQALKYDKTKFTIWNQVLIMEYQAAKYTELYHDSKLCLDLFPSIPSVYLLHGISSNQEKKFEEASKTLKAGKELVINDKALESEFFSQLGEAFFGLEKNREGIQNYESALRLEPTSTLIMNNYAYRLALAKIELDRAEELVKRANDLSPNYAHFIDTYGWVLFQKGEFKRAQEFFERGWKLSPKDRVIVEHMGDISSKMGDLKKALEFWIKAKELGSTNKVLDQKIEKKEYYEPVY
jgi:tetratricopeptide (TPR) repeat protein